MFQHQGVWLPAGERHFPEWMTRHGEIVDGRGTYQIKKWRACIPLIRSWRTAVDVGGHVGLWSMHLAKHFALVHAFEPVSAFRDCFTRNVGAENCILHVEALGAEAAFVNLVIPKMGDGIDTGGTHVAGVGDIAMVPLDGLELTEVDFIKIDCEGYEHQVIEGARETIERWKPTIIVEQKPHKLGPNYGIQGTPAVDLLRSMRYTVVRELGGDYILTTT